MKTKLMIVFFALMALTASAFGQVDLGEPDSVIMVITPAHVGSGDSVVLADLYIFNDAQDLASAGVGFAWFSDSLVLDSGVFTAEALAAFDFTRFMYYKNNIDSSNEYGYFQFCGARMASSGLAMNPSGRTHVATYYFHVTGLDIDDTLTTITDSAFSGATVTKFTSTVSSLDQYIPVWEGDVKVYDYTSGVDDDDPENLPTKFELRQNYPNPFNPTTKIEYDVAKKSHVRLDVFNVLGQRVTTLVNEEKEPGNLEVYWSGTNDGGNKVASGVYFYRLTADDELIETKKMMLLK